MESKDVEVPISTILEADAHHNARTGIILNKKLGPDYVASRKGGGGNVSYIEGWRAMGVANDIFGFNGWFTTIRRLDTDFVDYNESTKAYHIGVTCIMRVTLRDGAFHEDVGYGKSENVKSKADGIDKAKKEAVTDSIKRTLKNFGSVLGGCLYDKNFLKGIAQMKTKKYEFPFNDLYEQEIRTVPAATARVPYVPPVINKPSVAVPPSITSKPVVVKSIPPVKPVPSTTTNNKPAPKLPIVAPKPVYHQPNQVQGRPVVVDPIPRVQTVDLLNDGDDEIYAKMNLDPQSVESIPEVDEFGDDSGFFDGEFIEESKTDHSLPDTPPIVADENTPPVTAAVAGNERFAEKKAEAQRIRLERANAPPQHKTAAQALPANVRGVSPAVGTGNIALAPKHVLRPAQPPPRSNTVPRAPPTLPNHLNRSTTLPTGQAPQPYSTNGNITHRAPANGGKVPALSVGGPAGKLNGGTEAGSMAVEVVSSSSGFMSGSALKRSHEEDQFNGAARIPLGGLSVDENGGIKRPKY